MMLNDNQSITQSYFCTALLPRDTVLQDYSTDIGEYWHELAVKMHKF